MSRHTGETILSRGAPGAGVLAVSFALLLALSGCAPQAPAATSAGVHSSASSRATTTPTPGSSTAPATPTAPATSGPVASTPPTPPPAPPAAGDTAGAKALAVRACQAISSGFAADNVAQAAPLAAQAAAADSKWGPLAADLDFIQKNPIDPNTGEGPQKTADDASAAAHDCFTLAGVQVSQD